MLWDRHPESKDQLTINAVLMKAVLELTQEVKQLKGEL